MSKIIDISQPVSPRAGAWPGDTPFSFEWKWSLDHGDSCNVSSVTASPHVGTHADAPLHFLADGASIAEVPLECYWGPCLVLDGPREGLVRPEHFDSVDFATTPRVLIRTHDQPADDPVGFPKVFVALSPEAAQALRDRGAQLVGLDTPSMDPVDSKELPAHKILASARVAILENLALSHVKPGAYELLALPLRWQGLDASPVRAALRSP